MLSTTALALALLSPATMPQETSGRMMHMKGPENSFERLLVSINDERRDPPKVSPLHQWMFEWVTAGLGRQGQTDAYQLRFRVFSQQRKENNDPAYLATRMLLRMWDNNVRKLGYDHANIYDQGCIHVYLCFGGKPGGEQQFGEDEEAEGYKKKVNMIYIYALPSFTQPLEMARELAHEYGHATLAPVGGFKTPEDWANGYLGEKLYLRWMRDDIAANRLKPEDAMGATLKDLDGFVKKEVDPLMDAPALKGIDPLSLKSEGQYGMDAYVGLALYSETLLPKKVFGRSMAMNGTMKAEDYPAAVALAVETQVEQDKRLLLAIPERYKDKDVWVPTGEKGKVTNALIVKRDKGWSLIKVGAGAIYVVPGSTNVPVPDFSKTKPAAKAPSKAPAKAGSKGGKR